MRRRLERHPSDVRVELRECLPHASRSADIRMPSVVVDIVKVRLMVGVEEEVSFARDGPIDEVEIGAISEGAIELMPKPPRVVGDIRPSRETNASVVKNDAVRVVSERLQKPLHRLPLLLAVGVGVANE